MAVLGVGYAYIGWRLIGSARLAARPKRSAWLGLGLLFLLPFGSILVMRRHESLADPFAWIAYLILGFLSFVLTLLVGRDLFWPFLRAARMDPSRRRFLFQVSN